MTLALAPAMALAFSLPARAAGVLAGAAWQRDLGMLLSLAALAGGAALIWAVAMRRMVERRTRELQDQRQSLHTLVSTLPDLVFVKDLKGVYRACNPAFERVFGKPEAGIIGHTDHALTTPEQADAQRQHDLDALAANRPLMSEDWLTLAADGSKALFETIKAPMRDASGRVIGVLGIARDVTQHRHAEQRLRRLNQLYRVLGRVQDAAHVKGDPSSLYAAICQAVVEEGGMSLAWIGSTDDRRETLRPVQRAGDTLQPLPPLRIGNLQRPGWTGDEPGRGGSSATAALRAWREGSTALVLESPAQPALPGMAAVPAGGAWLAMPLKVDTEVRAVLCMRAEQAERFDAEEVGVLERLAMQVSLRLTADEAEAARQKVVSALRDSEARFSLMFQTSPVGMLLKSSPGGRVADVNQAWLDLCGYQRSEVIGPGAPPLALWVDTAQHAAAMAELQETGRVSGREMRLRKRSGEQVDIAYSATRTPLGGQDHLLASFVDITLQKHATRRAEEEADQLEHEVARRTAELNSLFEALPDLYFRLSPAGVVLDYRAGNTVTLLRDPAQFLGRPVREVLPGDAADKLMAALAQVGASQQPVSIEYALAMPAGEQTYEARIVPTEPGGDLVAVVRNVSERHALETEREAAREEAERQARHRSEFLANMSHEIRTPLNAILGFAQLGFEQTQGRVTQTGYNRILSAGKLLLAIVNDVLDYSKIEAGRMDVESIPASPRQLIDATADMVRDTAQQKGLALRVHLAPELPLACMTDPTRLQQILANLLANAVKFTHKGGIDLLADRDGNGDGEWLRIRVQDSGIGMNAGQREALFAPFRQADASTTRRYGGTGLGLAISRQLAELMGGEITVHSTLGVGSEFTLRLPLRAVPARWQQLSLAEDDMPRSGPQLEGLRLLVAEDNPVNQIVIKQALSSAGARVTLAADGREAVNLVTDSPDGFDAVLMDIQMPEMDGYEATRRIRLLAPQLPVIGQTAHALQEERDQCLACGMVAHVAKPIDLARLIATLRAVMRQPVA
ncbi:hypothetical protein GCM10009107_55080 [Ideonella azotifigens]|uniref:histidine kinase n=1 Tax=Ideonella azotifigens TaxID=513160 RepID=A0ABN1KH82_9BURK